MATTDETYDRLTVDRSTPDDEPRGRLRRLWDTLQLDTEEQNPETVTRSATLQITGGNVEDVDPPEDIDEFVELYKDIGTIRKNINEFVDDVINPGVRVLADDDATEAYFMGGEDAPESAPEDGFLSECMVFDEKRQPFNKGLEVAIRDRWVRGTVLVEYVRADDEAEDPDAKIRGFKFIRPETVSARTYPNTVQLIAPEDTANADILTPRGEAAAYVQFDEQAIMGRRLRDRDREQFNKSPFADDTASRPLSQNDVLKLVLDQDIGGSDAEAGVFGTSIIRAIKDDAEELRDIKRNLTKAVQGKAWGIWTLQMNDHVIETGDGAENILVRWEDGDIDDVTTEAENLGPGDVLSTDALIELGRHDGDVPDLEWVFKKYNRDIIDPLPAPFYKHADAIDINQFVVEPQQEDYQDRIRKERQFQAAQWGQAFREVAERHPDLDPSGLAVSVEAKPDESPILSLDEDTMDRLSTFTGAVADIYGPGGAPAFIQEQVLNELILQLPEEATLEGDLDGDELGLDALADLDHDHDLEAVLNGG